MRLRPPDNPSPQKRLTRDEFVIRAITTLRKPPYRGIHAVYSHFNDCYRAYFFGEDPIPQVDRMVAEGKIQARKAKGGKSLYLPGEMQEPRQVKTNRALARMGLYDLPEGKIRSTLYWRPKAAQGFTLPDPIKVALRERYGAYGDIVHNKLGKLDLNYLRELNDAGIEGAKQLVEAVEEHGVVLLDEDFWEMKEETREEEKTTEESEK